MTTITQTPTGRPVTAAESDMTELGRRVARQLAAQKHLTGLPVPEPLRIIRVAADLKVGDWLTLGDQEVLITHLNPATRAETLAEGRREVWSLDSCYPMDATDPVKASPREIAAQVEAVTR